MVILDLWGVSFHALVVFGLDKKLFVLGYCEASCNSKAVMSLVEESIDFRNFVGSSYDRKDVDGLGKRFTSIYFKASKFIAQLVEQEISGCQLLLRLLL